MSRGYFYMGSPYSKFPGGLEAAYDAAVFARGRLLLAGVPCFSPIVNSHPVAMRCGIDPRDHAIWLPDDAPFMEAAKGMIVAMMDGWQESFGVQEEIKFFLNAGKPIHYWPQETPAAAFASAYALF